VLAHAIPKAMVKVASSVFQASILRDRHEEDDCCNEEVLSSRSTTFIDRVHAIAPYP
jgi:hypothetical protein